MKNLRRKKCPDHLKKPLAENEGEVFYSAYESKLKTITNLTQEINSQLRATEKHMKQVANLLGLEQLKVKPKAPNKADDKEDQIIEEPKPNEELKKNGEEEADRLYDHLTDLVDRMDEFSLSVPKSHLYFTRKKNPTGKPSSTTQAKEEEQFDLLSAIYRDLSLKADRRKFRLIENLPHSLVRNCTLLEIQLEKLDDLKEKGASDIEGKESQETCTSEIKSLNSNVREKGRIILKRTDGIVQQLQEDAEHSKNLRRSFQELKATIESP